MLNATKFRNIKVFVVGHSSSDHNISRILLVMREDLLEYMVENCSLGTQSWNALTWHVFIYISIYLYIEREWERRDIHIINSLGVLELPAGIHFARPKPPYTEKVYPYIGCNLSLGKPRDCSRKKEPEM